MNYIIKNNICFLSLLGLLSLHSYETQASSFLSWSGFKKSTKELFTAHPKFWIPAGILSTATIWGSKSYFLTVANLLDTPTKTIIVTTVLAVLAKGSLSILSTHLYKNLNRIPLYPVYP